jgi:hypothetical protein
VSDSRGGSPDAGDAPRPGSILIYPAHSQPTVEVQVQGRWLTGRAIARTARGGKTVAYRVKYVDEDEKTVESSFAAAEVRRLRQ